MTQNLNWMGGSDARVTRPPTQKQFCAQTRVGQRPLASQTFETVKVTGAALAIRLVYSPELSQGRRQSVRRAGWSHDSAPLEEVDHL